MEKYKIYQIGCGKMSKYTIRYALEKGYEVVGGCDINPDITGKTMKEVLGVDCAEITISNINNLDRDLKALKPDVAIVTTTSLISELEEILTICANNGVNAITTCEEALYPSVSNPNVYKRLNELAIKNNCTLTGTGYQDVFWGNLIYTLGGATHKITKIKGSSSYNVEDYGIALAEVHGAGFTVEEFDSKVASADRISLEERTKLIENGEFTPSYMWNTVAWLADRFNLKIISMEQKCVPIIADEDINSNTLNMTITKGDCTGMSAVVTAQTKEGIEIEAECIGKVYKKDEFDKNEWTLYGEPETTVVINKPDTVGLTCASVINRIVDVINSKPGYVETSKLGEIKYQK